MKRVGGMVLCLTAALAALPVWGDDEEPATPAVTEADTHKTVVPAKEAEEGTATSVTSDINSAYVWRGITFAKDGVWQPSLDVSNVKVGKVRLGLNVWTNFNLTSWDERLQSGQFSEVDFTLSAELPGGFRASYIEYVFAVGGSVDYSTVPEPSTREVMVGWSRDFAVTPTLCLYYDVEAIQSPFLFASLAREQKLNDKTSVTLTAEAGLAGKAFAEYYGGAKGGLYHYALAARGSYQATGRLGLSVLLGYSGGFDKEILPKKVGLYGPYAGVSLNLGL